MLTDPQSVTLSGSTISLPRVETGLNRSVYRSADRLLQGSVEHQVTKAKRLIARVRFDQTKIAADPLTAENVEMSQTIHFSTDRPLVGFSVTEVKALVTMFETWLTDAVVEAMYGGQS